MSPLDAINLALLAAATGEDTPLSLPADDRAAQTASSSGGSLVRTVVGLAVVVAVIYGLHWVLKQVKAGREERAAGSGLQSAASVPLGPNRSLHLVRAGTELVLLGVAEGGVTPIRTYTEDEARDVGLLGEDELEPAAPAPTPPAARPALSVGSAMAALRRRTVRS